MASTLDTRGRLHLERGHLADALKEALLLREELGDQKVAARLRLRIAGLRG